MNRGQWIGIGLVGVSVLGLAAQAVALFLLHGAVNDVVSSIGTAVVVAAFIVAAVLFVGPNRRSR